MIDIIIHIGYPKTGTSFLQKRYLKVLAERRLLHFVNNHSDLMAECLQIENQNELTFDAQEMRSKFDDYLIPGQVNVISRESFTGSDFYKYVNTSSIARKLKCIFPEAKVLISLRNQADFATSIYSQYIQEGGVLGFNKFFGFDEKKSRFTPREFSIDNHQFDMGSLDYLKIVDYYLKLWGENHIKILLFETLKRDIIPYLLELNKFLGVSLNKNEVRLILDEVGQLYVNKSYTRNQITFARIANRFFRSHFNHIYEGIPLLRRNDVMNFRLVFRKRFFRMIFGGGKLKSEEFRRVTMANFNKSNTLLFQRYLPNSNEEDRGLYID